MSSYLWTNTTITSSLRRSSSKRPGLTYWLTFSVQKVMRHTSFHRSFHMAWQYANFPRRTLESTNLQLNQCCHLYLSKHDTPDFVSRQPDPRRFHSRLGCFRNIGFTLAFWNFYTSGEAIPTTFPIEFILLGEVIKPRRPGTHHTTLSLGFLQPRSCALGLLSRWPHCRGSLYADEPRDTLEDFQRKGSAWCTARWL